jgi:nitronate monooxygenase
VTNRYFGGVANLLTDVLGIESPIFLGPFGGMSSVALTAAVSELGGLGAFGLYGYPGERIRETTDAVRAATNKPFGYNLWLPHEEQNSDGPHASFADAEDALAPFFAELGLEPPAEPASYLPIRRAIRGRA